MQHLIQEMHNPNQNNGGLYMNPVIE